MSEFKAPYNFVPLTRFILRPDWAEQANHDHPFADGLSGELTYTLTTHTPLCVGGKQTKATDHSPRQVAFYRTPDNQPAIPGSSLKGMLRAVTEIATFGHFRQVEDRRLGVRDISRGDNFYSRYMREGMTHAGWLRFDDGRWTLTRCNYVRVEQAAIIQHFDIKDPIWTKKENDKAKNRYNLLGGLRDVVFTKGFHKRHTCGIAEKLGQGDCNGHLVVTGQPGSNYRARNAKKWEFIFYQPGETVEVSPQVMSDFQFIHSDSSEWKYWQDQLSDLTPGVPVFYHSKPDGSARSMGLAMLYKVAYKHTLHDAIGHTSAAHLDTHASDMADLLFGRLDSGTSGEYGNLRGRVNVGLATSLTPEVATTLQQPTILNGPKPTFYPAYIAQRETGPYQTLMDKSSELSGWKRYPVKSLQIQAPQTNNENLAVQVRLETVPTDSQFSGKIRFHNLRPVELGALLWSLDFGEHPELRHGLGTGKPYGFGQVSLSIDHHKSVVRANDPTLEINDIDMLLAACRAAFDDYIQSSWSAAVGDDNSRWDRSEPLNQLMEMANPLAALDPEDLVYWTEPGEFADAKNKGHKRQAYKEPDRSALSPAQNYCPQPTGANLSLDEAYQRVEVQKAEKAAEAQRVQQKLEREAAKALMGDDEKLLVEIDELLSGEINSTTPKKIEKKLKDVLDSLIDPEYPLRDQLPELLERCESLDKKIINKLCKKIRALL